MAEFLMKDLVKKRGMEKDFIIESAATSSEETGNPVHHGTRQKLAQYNISTNGKYARKLTKSDYDTFDYLIGMEYRNTRNILSIIGEDPSHKVFRLLDLTEQPRDIADPWYTDNFDRTFDDIQEGLEALFTFLMEQEAK